MIPPGTPKEPAYASLIREIENGETFDLEKIIHLAIEIFDNQPDILQFQSIDNLLRSYKNTNPAVWGVIFKVDKIMQERVLARVRKGLSEEELSKLFTQLHSSSNKGLIASVMQECAIQYPLQTLEQLPSFANSLGGNSQTYATIEHLGFNAVESHMKDHSDQLFAKLKQIQDQKLLYSLAIVCSKQDVVATLKHFADFRISSKDIGEFSSFFFTMPFKQQVHPSTAKQILADPHAKKALLDLAHAYIRYSGSGGYIPPSLPDIRDKWKDLLPPQDFLQLCKIIALHDQGSTALDTALGRKRGEEGERLTIIVFDNEVYEDEDDWFELLLFQACCQVARGEAHLVDTKDYGDFASPDRRAVLARYHKIIAEHPEIFDRTKPLKERRENALTFLGSLWGADALSDSSLHQAFGQICKYRNGPIALELLYVLTQKVAPSKTAAHAYKIAVEGAAYLRLAMLPLSVWMAEGSKESTSAEFTSLLQPFRKALKDTASGLEQSWLTTTLALDEAPLSSERKLQIMKQLLQAKNVEELLNRLSSIHILCKNAKSALLDREFTKDMTAELVDCLKSVVGEFLTADNVTRFMDTLGGMRSPYAWKQYELKLKATASAEALSCYTQFLNDVLDGISEKTRYERTTAHIAKIRENHETIWQKWQQKMPPGGIEVDLTNRNVFSFPEFLRAKIADKHVDERFKSLIAFANNQTVPNMVKENDPVSQIEKRLLALCSHPLVGDKLLLRIEEIVKLCDALTPGIELSNDLKGVLKQLPQRKGLRAYQIVNTDDWQDLLLCGTEVQGSCQLVNGDPNFNKGLLGYLIDGKNQLIAIKDEKGALVARCIVRLLWDETEQCPALFQERIYSNMNSVEIDKALHAAAAQLAEHIGCKLYRKEGLDVGVHKLVSLASPSPFEYVDAVGGVTNGRYEINLNPVKE